MSFAGSKASGGAVGEEGRYDMILVRDDDTQDERTKEMPCPKQKPKEAST